MVRALVLIPHFNSQPNSNYQTAQQQQPHGASFDRMHPREQGSGKQEGPHEGGQQREMKQKGRPHSRHSAQRQSGVAKCDIPLSSSNAQVSPQFSSPDSQPTEFAEQQIAGPINDRQENVQTQAPPNESSVMESRATPRAAENSIQGNSSLVTKNQQSVIDLTRSEDKESVSDDPHESL